MASYRYAVTQAARYREFLRQAAHLAPWLEQFALDHTACRAAVAVPEIRSEHARWRDRLQRACEVFDIELVTVPERLARAGRLEG